MGLSVEPTRRLIWLTVLSLPRLKVAPAPVPARAAVATPNTTARITARPTKKTVALPTHITLLAALLSMFLSSREGAGALLPGPTSSYATHRTRQGTMRASPKWARSKAVLAVASDNGLLRTPLGRSSQKTPSTHSGN